MSSPASRPGSFSLNNLIDTTYKDSRFYTFPESITGGDYWAIPDGGASRTEQSEYGK